MKVYNFCLGLLKGKGAMIKSINQIKDLLIN